MVELHRGNELVRHDAVTCFRGAARAAAGMLGPSDVPPVAPAAPVTRCLAQKEKCPLVPRYPDQKKRGR